MASNEQRIPDFGTERIEFDVTPENRGFILLPAESRSASPAPDPDLIDSAFRTPHSAFPLPWVWYCPSFTRVPYSLPKPRHAWYISRLLAAGICVCGVDVGESWGNPAGREVYSAFHELCISDYNLQQKAIMWCQSRGGMMAYNWAPDHTDCVKAIGGIYPVVNAECHLKPTILNAFGMDEAEFLAELEKHNPLDRLEPLAKAGIPIFHVHGDADTVVPHDEHSLELEKRYKALGGEVRVKVVSGKGHEEVFEFFQCTELLDFFLEQTKC